MNDWDKMIEMLDRASVRYATDKKSLSIHLIETDCYFKIRADMALDDIYGAMNEEW